jgi:hypothetical protein
MNIGPQTIPLRSKDVVTRKDSQGVLLFQVRTDEMHFISESAFALFSLCDGSRTVGEIQQFVAAQQREMASPDGCPPIAEFIASLAQRNVIELIA